MGYVGYSNGAAVLVEAGGVMNFSGLRHDNIAKALWADPTPL